MTSASGTLGVNAGGLIGAGRFAAGGAGGGFAYAKDDTGAIGQSFDDALRGLASVRKVHHDLITYLFFR